LNRQDAKAAYLISILASSASRRFPSSGSACRYG